MGITRRHGKSQTGDLPMKDAVDAVDGLLHSAVDYWQARALKAEAAVKELRRHACLQSPETAPKEGEYIVGVWEGSWNNVHERLRFYHATGYSYGPRWPKQYRTEEGEAYKLAGWLPWPRVE